MAAGAATRAGCTARCFSAAHGGAAGKRLPSAGGSPTTHRILVNEPRLGASPSFSSPVQFYSLAPAPNQTAASSIVYHCRATHRPSLTGASARAARRCRNTTSAGALGRGSVPGAVRLQVVRLQGTARDRSAGKAAAEEHCSALLSSMLRTLLAGPLHWCPAASAVSRAHWLMLSCCRLLAS